MTACKSNLKNVGTACEMYSTDAHGAYPPALSLLTPNYLKSIPTCPAAKAETYSAGYATAPKAYTVFCQGSYHTSASTPVNYPQYSASQGLIYR